MTSQHSPTPSVVIIGAGIAGLSAGWYLQRNGFSTEIFEMHGIPGGLCTSWDRKGYRIEGCIHGLLGSSPSHPLYRLWNEVIDMQSLGFVDSDSKHVYLFPDGTTFRQSANLDILERDMREIAPEDKLVIREFIGDTRKFQKLELPYDTPREFFSLRSTLKMITYLPQLGIMKKWMNVSAETFASRFKNPLLRSVVRHFSSPVLFEMFVLSEMDRKRCGYPLIGSREFARLFSEKYLELGGKIHYRTKIRHVTTLNGTATGVTLENGAHHPANIVVSAADGKTTLETFLDGKITTDKIAHQYRQGNLNPSKIQISFGIRTKLQDCPPTLKIVLSSPYVICDGTEYNAFDVLCYTHEPAVPEGATLLVIQLDTTKGAYWQELRKRDRVRYRVEKESIASGILNILDKKLGDIDDFVEMTDIATPATYIRYTGNWNGSIQGWANENIFRPNPFAKQLPGLQNFFMIGQWVEPGGGIPNAFKSGRDCAQILCKHLKRPFRSR